MRLLTCSYTTLRIQRECFLQEIELDDNQIVSYLDHPKIFKKFCRRQNISALKDTDFKGIFSGRVSKINSEFECRKRDILICVSYP